MTPQTGSETGIESDATLGYLPKNERDWMWFGEGICAGASVVMIIVALAVYFGG